MTAPPRARFLDLFAVEAQTRLRRLAEHILVLETGAGPDIVAAILRDAHSLKGAAAVVSLTDVSTLVHALEGALEPYRTTPEAPPAELVDALLTVVDGLGELVPAIVAGTAPPDATAPLLAVLSGRGQRIDPAPAALVEPAAEPSLSAATTAASVAVLSPPAPPSAPDGAIDPRGSASTGGGPAPVEVIELPAARIDQIVRSVGETAATSLRLGRVLGERFGTDPSSIAEFRNMSRSIRDLHVQATKARTVPIATVTGRLHRAVRDVARRAGKDVLWQVEGEDTELDRAVLQQLTDSLLHIVRNAVDHGVERPDERVAVGKPPQATVRLVARHIGSDVIISIGDDGRGIDTERLRDELSRRGTDASTMADDAVHAHIFSTGVSTAAELSETSGRGVGLDVVRTNLERLRGRIDVASTPGAGTEFRIAVPVAAAVVPCLIVTAGTQRLAIPLASVAHTQADEEGAVTRVQGAARVRVGDALVPLAALSELVGLDAVDRGPIVVVAHDECVAAFRVGALLGQRDLMLTGLGPFVPRLAIVSGTSVEMDGSILFALDPAALIATVARRSPVANGAAASGREEAAARPMTVLVADDALPVRELQRSILEDAGYRVHVAEDGAQALAVLAREPVDLVLTDVDMPNVDGFALTRAIRQMPQLANVPVLILSARASADDHAAGLEAGADGYIVKQDFGEAALLSAVEQLLGRTS